MSANADAIANPPEGSFIKLSAKRRRGMFLCAMCMSPRLRHSYNGTKHILYLTCMRCGNVNAMNFALEVSDVG